MNLKLTVRSEISETCTEASVTLRSVTSLELINNEKGGSVTDCHSISPVWRNHCSQLLNMHVVSDVRQTEIQQSRYCLN